MILIKYNKKKNKNLNKGLNYLVKVQSLNNNNKTHSKIIKKVMQLINKPIH